MVKNVATYIIASYMLWWLKLGMLGSCSGHFCLAEEICLPKPKPRGQKMLNFGSWIGVGLTAVARILNCIKADKCDQLAYIYIYIYYICYIGIVSK